MTERTLTHSEGRCQTRQFKTHSLATTLIGQVTAGCFADTSRSSAHHSPSRSVREASPALQGTRSAEWNDFSAPLRLVDFACLIAGLANNGAPRNFFLGKSGCGGRRRLGHANLPLRRHSPPPDFYWPIAARRRNRQTRLETNLVSPHVLVLVFL